LAHLPAFHPTALRLLTVSTESETALEDFEECFRSDPALASELLLTANSAEFGLRATVESIRHALALLGLERVSSLSFTIAMKFYMRNTPRRQVIHPIWSHSVASALIAETFGEALHNPLRSLYTAGLLHEVGRLGLLMSEGNKYESLLTQLHDSLDDANRQEKETCGVDHAEAGAVMAEAWGIPSPVCGSIRHHHDVPAGEPDYNELVDLVRLSCRFASSLGYPEQNCRHRESLESVSGSIPPAIRANPAVSPERLTARIKRMLGSVW
jgi:HD-like signal output (HDOD) protein